MLRRPFFLLLFTFSFKILEEGPHVMSEQPFHFSGERVFGGFIPMILGRNLLIKVKAYIYKLQLQKV